jgi:hypothetical protein
VLSPVPVAGYDKLDAGIVRSVYPTVPSNLAAIFATYQFYRLEIVVETVTIMANGQTALARCKLFHTLRPNINARDQRFDERMDVTLQKQGDAWFIIGLRKR